MQCEKEAETYCRWYALPLPVANESARRQVTQRDLEVLLALDCCPLTVRQLLKLSATFEAGAFSSIRGVQERLHKLHQAGWVRRWRYATASRGAAPEYYKITLLGYRLLYGAEAIPPTKRHFSEVGVAHQQHTLSLSEFIVHTTVAAHRRGIRMVNFFRENTLCLTMNGGTLFPDCAFELLTHERIQYNFLVELDNGTERIRSDKDAESWQRKLRLYDQIQNRSHPHRFRVLIVNTRSRDRLRHILDAAATLTSNPNRSLFYGVHLGDYLETLDAVCGPCFLDHRGQPTPLIPLPHSGILIQGDPQR